MKKLLIISGGLLLGASALNAAASSVTNEKTATSTIAAMAAPKKIVLGVNVNLANKAHVDKALERLVTEKQPARGTVQAFEAAQKAKAKKSVYKRYKKLNGQIAQATIDKDPAAAFAANQQKKLLMDLHKDEIRAGLQSDATASSLAKAVSSISFNN